MAKSIKSVYFESELMLMAEQQDININHICNEALRLALHPADSVAGAEILTKAEQAKDNQTMTKAHLNISTPRGRAIWAKAVGLYSAKYGMTEIEVLRKFQ